VRETHPQSALEIFGDDILELTKPVAKLADVRFEVVQTTHRLSDSRFDRLQVLLQLLLDTLC
jgi:hypothetical protein